MRLIDFTAIPTERITLFDSIAASSQVIANGHGEAHGHWLRCEPGAKTGTHPAGFGQLFVVIEGSGWAIGADGQRIDLAAGQGVLFQMRGTSLEG